MVRRTQKGETTERLYAISFTDAHGRTVGWNNIAATGKADALREILDHSQDELRKLSQAGQWTIAIRQVK